MWHLYAIVCNAQITLSRNITTASETKEQLFLTDYRNISAVDTKNRGQKKFPKYHIRTVSKPGNKAELCRIFMAFYGADLSIMRCYSLPLVTLLSIKPNLSDTPIVLLTCSGLTLYISGLI